MRQYYIWLASFRSSEMSWSVVELLKLVFLVPCIFLREHVFSLQNCVHYFVLSCFTFWSDFDAVSEIYSNVYYKSNTIENTMDVSEDRESRQQNFLQFD